MATELGVELCLLGSLLLEVKISYRCFPRLGFPSGSVIKNLLANTGTAGDLGSTPGLRRTLEEIEMETHSRILAWKIPWVEEAGGL